VKTFLLFRDKDYSDGAVAWQQLQHLLPSDQDQQQDKAFPESIYKADSDTTASYLSQIDPLSHLYV
jgi:hypothetical protein